MSPTLGAHPPGFLDRRDVRAQRFDNLGLRLSFGDHVEVCDEFASSSIEQRVSDLHDAFRDPGVAAILTAIGGYNSNQLLPHLDWDLIEANPKIVCGYSDITALTCSIYARTGLVTYSGPHYSTFGMKEHLGQTLEWFTAALMAEAPFRLEPARTWSDDAWYLDQDSRRIEDNDGWWVMAPGQAEGRLIGGNLCTLNLLQGTEFMPDLSDSIVFVEDDFESMPHTFDPDLTSLTHLPGFAGVRGLLVGRFQREVEMTQAELAAIIANNSRLAGLPILANVDVGHTDPIATLPVGGSARMEAGAGSSRLEIAT